MRHRTLHGQLIWQRDPTPIRFGVEFRHPERDQRPVSSLVGRALRRFAYPGGVGKWMRISKLGSNIRERERERNKGFWGTFSPKRECF